jgi:hypothetical protein
MGWECGTHGIKYNVRTKFQLENEKGRDGFKDQGLVVNKILKLILKK